MILSRPVWARAQRTLQPAEGQPFTTFFVDRDGFEALNLSNVAELLGVGIAIEVEIHLRVVGLELGTGLRHEAIEAVQQSIESLPNDYRQAVQLRLLEGKSLTETENSFRD